MATNWGFPGSITEFCKKAKGEGYDGIEVWMPGDDKGRKEVMDAAAQHNLLVGFLYGGGDADFTKHQEQFKNGINEAAKIKAGLSQLPFR